MSHDNDAPFPELPTIEDLALGPVSDVEMWKTVLAETWRILDPIDWRSWSVAEQTSLNAERAIWRVLVISSGGDLSRLYHQLVVACWQDFLAGQWPHLRAIGQFLDPLPGSRQAG